MSDEEVATITVTLSGTEVRGTEFKMWDGDPIRAFPGSGREETETTFNPKNAGLLSLLALLAKTAACSLRAGGGNTVGCVAQGGQDTVAWRLYNVSGQPRKWVGAIFGAEANLQTILAVSTVGDKAIRRAQIRLKKLPPSNIGFIDGTIRIKDAARLDALAAEFESRAVKNGESTLSCPTSPEADNLAAHSSHAGGALSSLRLFPSGADAIDAMKELIRRGRPASAVLVQHSGALVNGVVRDLLNRGADVDLFVQLPANDVVVPNKYLRDRIVRSVQAYLDTNSEVQRGRRLRVIGYRVPASLRCIMVDGLGILVGHYVHHLGMLAATVKRREEAATEEPDGEDSRFYPFGNDGPTLLVPAGTPEYQWLRTALAATIHRMANPTEALILEVHRDLSTSINRIGQMLGPWGDPPSARSGMAARGSRNK